MLALQTFENLDLEANIGILVDNRTDEIWFDVSDICRSLNIKNVSDVVKRLDEDEKQLIERSVFDPSASLV